MKKVVVATLVVSVFMFTGMSWAFDLKSYGSWNGTQGQGYESYNSQGIACSNNGIAKVQTQGLQMGQNGSQTSAVSPNWNVHGCVVGGAIGANDALYGVGGKISGNAGAAPAGAWGTQTQAINAANGQANGSIDLEAKFGITKTANETKSGEVNYWKTTDCLKTGAVNSSDTETFSLNKNFNVNAAGSSELEAKKSSFGAAGFEADGWVVAGAIGGFAGGNNSVDWGVGGIIAGAAADDFEAKAFGVKKSSFEAEKEFEFGANGSSGFGVNKTDVESKTWNIENKYSKAGGFDYTANKAEVETINVGLSVHGNLDYQYQNGGGSSSQTSGTCAGIQCNQAPNGNTH